VLPRRGAEPVRGPFRSACRTPLCRVPRTPRPRWLDRACRPRAGVPGDLWTRAQTVRVPADRAAVTSGRW